MKAALLSLAGIGLFTALLLWMTLRESGVQCEVCMEFGGGVYCSTVSAPTSEQAMAQAIQNACGILTSGMSSELQCQRSPVHSSSCRE